MNFLKKFGCCGNKKSNKQNQKDRKDGNRSSSKKPSFKPQNGENEEDDKLQQYQIAKQLYFQKNCPLILKQQNQNDEVICQGNFRVNYNGTINSFYIVFFHDLKLSFFKSQNEYRENIEPTLILSMDFTWYYHNVEFEKLQKYGVISSLIKEDSDKMDCSSKQGVFLGQYYSQDRINQLVVYTQDEDLQQKVLNYCFYRLYQKNFQSSFKTIKKLGSGASASVYLVQKRETKQFYAAKIFSKKKIVQETNGEEQQIQEKFESIHYEIKLMSMMDHQNIMQMYEIFQDNEKITLILDAHEGGTLDFHLNKYQSSLNKREIANIMRQLFQAILHMNEKGLMHRDLKFENILVKKKKSLQVITLADFGLSTEINLEKYLFRRVGTPGFIAPEIFPCKDGMPMYDEQCDIFSLGCILHLLLLKRPVFSSQDGNELFQENSYCSLDFSKPMYQKLSIEELNLLKGMMRKDPKQRLNIYDLLSHPYFVDKDSNSYSPQIYSEKVIQINSNNGSNNQQQTNVTSIDIEKKQELNLKKLREQLQQEYNSFVVPNSNVLKGQDLTDSVKMNQNDLQSAYVIDSQGSTQSNGTFKQIPLSRQKSKSKKKQHQNLEMIRKKQYTNSSFYSNSKRQIEAPEGSETLIQSGTSENNKNKVYSNKNNISNSNNNSNSNRVIRRHSCMPQQVQSQFLIQKMKDEQKQIDEEGNGQQNNYQTQHNINNNSSRRLSKNNTQGPRVMENVKPLRPDNKDLGILEDIK